MGIHPGSKRLVRDVSAEILGGDRTERKAATMEMLQLLAPRFGVAWQSGILFINRQRCEWIEPARCS